MSVMICSAFPILRPQLFITTLTRSVLTYILLSSTAQVMVVLFEAGELEKVRLSTIFRMHGYRDGKYGFLFVFISASVMFDWYIHH